MGRTDLPAVFLRVEGAAVLALAAFLYWLVEGPLLLVLLLFLVPDLGMLGYLGGPRVGALVYNATHILLLPATLFMVDFLASIAGVGAGGWTGYLSLIWFGHIGLDRLLGFGLKHPSGFRDTNLGRIGRAREKRSAGD